MEIEGYEILGSLGAGGMGDVYLARDVKLDRMVALKLLSEKLCAQAGFRTRFLREIHALARLKHANLVPVFEGGIHGRTPHYSMAFVPGRSLQQVLRVLRARRDRGLEWFTPEALEEAAGLQFTGTSYIEMILWWILGLADALTHAHQKGILHLDLKPSNVMITPDGTPILLDFGVAQILEKGWGKGEFCGTPSYMAPERLLSRGRHVGEFSDAYSLAVLLFELLTLELPVPGRGMIELCRNHRNGVLRDPRDLQEKIPVELAQILRKALAKEPAVSYLDVRSFAEDLTKFRDFEPLQLPGIPLGLRLRRIARKWRRPLLRGAGGLVLGACLLLLFFYGARWRKGASETEREAEVQAYSFLSMARKALESRDLRGTQHFLQLARGMSKDPRLVEGVAGLETSLAAERDQAIRLLRNKVLAKDAGGVGELVQRLRPLIQGDPHLRPLLLQGMALERERR